jgi:hypothetical protein
MGSKTFSTMTKVSGREKDMWIMMVIYESGGKTMPQRGFKAQVTAYDVPGKENLEFKLYVKRYWLSSKNCGVNISFFSE